MKPGRTSSSLGKQETKAWAVSLVVRGELSWCVGMPVGLVVGVRWCCARKLGTQSGSFLGCQVTNPLLVDCRGLCKGWGVGNEPVVRKSCCLGQWCKHVGVVTSGLGLERLTLQEM